ncbi:MAG: UDP-N-acetylmuramoyl-tripeptide--D-alanyl-D-alanine ligase [Dehalococcoidia bacterium]
MTSGQITTGFIADVMRRHGYEVSAGPDVPVTGGTADSRSVLDGSLFAAYPGENTDGNLYVESALRGGASVVVCNREIEGEWPNRTIVVAPSTVKAMGELATAWRNEWHGTVVGITGTVGKTTAKELTADTLAARFCTHRSPGNYNSAEGLPLALLTLKAEHEVSVLEMAMDREGEIAELCEIARPSVGVVLNVGLTHIEKLGSIEKIRDEKLSLVRALPIEGIAILNGDDPRVGPEAGRLRCRTITFGSGEGNTLRATQLYDDGLDGTRMRLAYGGASVVARSPLPGTHTAPAALAAVASGIALGLTLEEAANALGAARTVGRMRTAGGRNGSTILDDRYNSSPASLAGALRLLATRQEGPRIALLGRMAELGEHEETEHRTAGVIAANCCDVIAAVGDAAKALIEAARQAGHRDAHWFESKDDAAAFVAERMAPGATVLLKASRSQAFETLLPALEATE